MIRRVVHGQAGVPEGARSRAETWIIVCEHFHGALGPVPSERLADELAALASAGEIQRGPAGACANFLGDEGEARVRQAYPGGTWERLAELKPRYDPTNLFRLNQNIPPA